MTVDDFIRDKLKHEGVMVPTHLVDRLIRAAWAASEAEAAKRHQEEFRALRRAWENAAAEAKQPS